MRTVNTGLALDVTAMATIIRWLCLNLTGGLAEAEISLGSIPYLTGTLVITPFSITMFIVIIATSS